VPLRDERVGDLFDVDELSSKVRVLGPVAVVRIEVALRVEERDVHAGEYTNLAATVPL
jgi:hypothetical protein